MPEGNGDGVRRHFSYANVMSTLAVFLVLAGGTAMAAAVESSRDIARQSVKNSDIKRDTIKSNRLKDGRAVQEVDVVPETLTGASILNGGIGTDDLADNSVNSAKVANESLGQADLGINSVDALELAVNSVSADELDTVTVRSSAPNPIPAGGEETNAVGCLPGEQVLSGGVANATFDLVTVTSVQSGSGWFGAVQNEGGASSWRVQVLCLAP